MNKLLRKTYKQTRRVLRKTKRFYKKNISGNGLTPLVIIGLIGITILAIALIVGDTDNSRILAVANRAQELSEESKSEPQSNEYSARALVGALQGDDVDIFKLLESEKASESQSVSRAQQAENAAEEAVAETFAEAETEAATEAQT